MTQRSCSTSAVPLSSGGHLHFSNDNERLASTREQPRAAACEVEELPPPPLAEPLISEAELAKRVGLPVDMLIRDRNAGLLRGYRLRGQWRFSRQQVDDYIASLSGMSRARWRRRRAIVCNKV